nr:uncharacterized aarF domain-containing protein kinase At4g31390, chloroplastic [Ipomoea batatas]
MKDLRNLGSEIKDGQYVFDIPTIANLHYTRQVKSKTSLVYDYVVGRDQEVVPFRARQLRQLLCDLGPSFIKAGQVMFFPSFQFDVAFPAIQCSLLSVDAMDISGEQHLDIDNFGRLHDRSKETPKAIKQLSHLFPNKVMIQIPQAEVTQRLSNAKEAAQRIGGLQSHEDLARKVKKNQIRIGLQCHVF